MVCLELSTPHDDLQVLMCAIGKLLGETLATKGVSARLTTFQFNKPLTCTKKAQMLKVNTGQMS
jgi:hypothetical protein